jgi:hypothetical protein
MAISKEKKARNLPKSSQSLDDLKTVCLVIIFLEIFLKVPRKMANFRQKTKSLG